MSDISIDQLREARVVVGEPIEIRAGRVLDIASHVAPAGSSHADKAIFLAHGGGGNKNQWRYQWRELVELGYNVIAWDFLGHGDSPRPAPTVAGNAGQQGGRSAYDGEETLLDYLAIFDRYKQAHNVFVGHSLGTGSTLRVLQHLRAQKRLGEVDAAVLLGTQLARPVRGGLFDLHPLILRVLKPVFERRFRRLAWGPDADPRLVRYETRIARRNTMAVMQAVIGNALWGDSDALAQLDLPIKVIAGRHDGLTPASGARALTAHLPRGEFVELASGHQLMLERPEHVNLVLAGVLAKVAQPPHAPDRGTFSAGIRVP